MSHLWFALSPPVCNRLQNRRDRNIDSILCDPNNYRLHLLYIGREFKTLLDQLIYIGVLI